MNGVWCFFSNSKMSTRSVYAPLLGTLCGAFDCAVAD